MNETGVGEVAPSVVEKPKLFETSAEARERQQLKGQKAMEGLVKTINGVSGFAIEQAEVGTGMVVEAVEPVVEGVKKKGREIANVATELTGDVVFGAIKVEVWAHETRNELANQAFDRTDKYLAKIRGEFDQAVTKTDKIGWKPLRDVVQQTMRLGLAAREVVAEVNNIVPRTVDTKSYGDDIRATISDVRGVVAEYQMGSEKLREHSDKIVADRARERMKEHREKARGHAGDAANLREAARRAREIK